MLLAALIVSLSLSLATAPALAAADLSAVKWGNRVLVLFAEPGDARYGQQQDLLDAVRDGLAERDVLVLGVVGESVSTLFGDLSGFDVDAVRHAAGRNTAEPFEVVLIGKDGGVKQRWTTPVSPDALFSTIDAMPMRANEMRR